MYVVGIFGCVVGFCGGFTLVLDAVLVLVLRR